MASISRRRSRCRASCPAASRSAKPGGTLSTRDDHGARAARPYPQPLGYLERDGRPRSWHHDRTGWHSQWRLRSAQRRRRDRILIARPADRVRRTISSANERIAQFFSMLASVWSNDKWNQREAKAFYSSPSFWRSFTLWLLQLNPGFVGELEGRWSVRTERDARFF
jgi:hypothetical protein